MTLDPPTLLAPIRLDLRSAAVFTSTIRGIAGISLLTMLASISTPALHGAPFTVAPIFDWTDTGLRAVAASFLPPDFSVNQASLILGDNDSSLGQGNGQTGTFADFSSGATGFAIQKGFILSTGVASDATGPYFGGPSTNMNVGGSAALSALAPNQDLFDAVEFRFSFTSPSTTRLVFNYAFGSSEYPDSVGSDFNDVLGIFVNGVNIAVVPGTNMPVSVNSVNAETNSKNFAGYSSDSTPFAYGGITNLLSAQASIQAGATNTVRFIIADGADHILDSAVFIQQYPPTLNPPAAVPEPSSLALAVIGSAWLIFRAQRKKSNAIRRAQQLLVAALLIGFGGTAAYGQCSGTSIVPGVPDYDPNAPMVPLQTRLISSDGSQASDYAIQVGKYKYTAPSLNTSTGLHVLVLTRSDLTCQINTSVPMATFDDRYFATLYFKNFPWCSDALGCVIVIQSLRQIGDWTSRVDVRDPFNTVANNLAIAFGATSPASTQGANTSTPHTGYSMVGTYFGPGNYRPFERFTCDQATDCGSIPAAAGASAIRGALILDNNNAFTFIYPGRAAFDTGTGGSSRRNAMTIGRNYGEATQAGTYRSEDLGGVGGFQVLVLYRDCLCVNTNNTYSINQLADMTTRLQQVAQNDNQLVMISSIGNVAFRTGDQQWANLGKAIEGVGGTFHVFAQLQNGDDYSLVGWGGARIGQGAVEQSSVIRKVTHSGGTTNPILANPATIHGVLKRDRFGNYAPTESGLATIGQSTVNMLDGVAFQMATPFPALSSDGLLQAYTALSGFATNSANSDIRSLYANSNADPDRWSINLSSQQYQATSRYSQQDWNTVKAQLLAEFRHLSAIKAFRNAVVAAYQTVIATGPNTTLNQVYQDVKNDIQPDNSSSISPTLLKVLGSFTSLAAFSAGLAGGPPAWIGVDLLVTGGLTALELSSSPSGAPLDKIETTFENLEAQTSQAFQQNLISLGRLFDLISVDWGRMQRLGAQLQSGQIDWTTNLTAAVTNVYNVSLRREFYTALLKSSYVLAHWNNFYWAWGSESPSLDLVCQEFKIWYLQDNRCPLSDGPDPSNWVSTSSTNFFPPSVLYFGWDVWKLGHDAMHASYWASADQFLDDIFTPVSPQNPKALGVYQPYFYLYMLQPGIQTCTNPRTPGEPDPSFGLPDKFNPCPDQ